MKITIIAGLPGSGKTTYANQMHDVDVIVDDPKEFYDIVSVGKVDHMVITDPLVILASREVVEERLTSTFGDDILIEWIYFENNVDKAYRNHLNRNKTEYRNISKSLYKLLESRYTIPHDATVLTIYGE